MCLRHSKEASLAATERSNERGLGDQARQVTRGSGDEVLHGTLHRLNLPQIETLTDRGAPQTEPTEMESQ